MELLVNFLKNSLYGEQIRRVIEKEYACKSEYWMLTEKDEKFKGYWIIGIGKYMVKLAKAEGKENDNNKANVVLLHLGAFVLSNGQRIMNNFVEANDGFKSNDLYYGDTGSLYFENRHCNKLDELGLIGEKTFKVKLITKTAVFGMFYFQHLKQNII